MLHEKRITQKKHYTKKALLEKTLIEKNLHDNAGFFFGLGCIKQFAARRGIEPLILP